MGFPRSFLERGFIRRRYRMSAAHLPVVAVRPAAFTSWDSLAVWPLLFTRPSMRDITEKHMPLVENATLRKLRSGGIALGFGVHHLRTAAAGMIAAAAGPDWRVFDHEDGAVF